MARFGNLGDDSPGVHGGRGGGWAGGWAGELRSCFTMRGVEAFGFRVGFVLLL